MVTCTSMMPAGCPIRTQSGLSAESAADSCTTVPGICAATAVQILASGAYYWWVLRPRGDWRVHVPDEDDGRRDATQYDRPARL